jgi:L-ascorbate metabolism protein UlaG (beta-lactamase superfamily)
MTRCVFVLLLLAWPMSLHAGESFEKDVLKTSAGDLEVTFIGHGSLMIKFDKNVIHVDPYSRLADYARLPDADLILITHHHRDHLDPKALNEIRGDDTVVFVNGAGAGKVDNATVMKNGDVKNFAGIKVEAVPAYNLVHKRDNGEFFHPKGQCNGYVLTFGDTRVYIAGDTENTPEMKALKDIDYAFLPMNLPYTMTPEMVADAVLAFKPAVLYPYHFGETDTSNLLELLANQEDTEIRVREMK